MFKLGNKSIDKSVELGVLNESQKENNKYKIVVANYVRQNSKGITLISLIITIIVMIILVGVTVNVALNGGLFDNAKKAAKETQYQADYEILQVAIVGAMDQNLKIPTSQALDDNLPDDWEDVIGNHGGPYKVTSPNGNVFTVEANGTIGGEENPEDKDLLLLERYFLGEDKAGKNLVDLVDMSQEETSFIDDIATDIKENEDIEFLILGISNVIEGEGTIDIYIKYNNSGYRISSTGTDGVNILNNKTTNVTKVYEPTGREGEKYLLDIDGDETEEECTILYDYGEGRGIEIVSPTTVGSDLTLGDSDSTIDWKDSEVIAEADLDGNSTLTNIEKSIYSYNHAIETINNYAKSQITNSAIPKENIRSVGSNPNNPYSENNTMYISNNLASWNSTYNGVVKSGDTNYEQDLMRMSYFGVSNINELYLLASRYTSEEMNDVNFMVRGISTDGIFIGNSLFGIESSGYAGYNNFSSKVRPIVKIPNI